MAVGSALAASALARCSSTSHGGSQGTIAVQSPVATTLSWFAAVNAHDKALALAHFVPADRDMMEWSAWGPGFTHLQCSLRSGSATSADVHCTFDPIYDANAGMSGDSFWDVYLQREPGQPWLINNYGHA